GVPRERPHPAVGADTQLVEDAAETPGALGPLAVRDAFLPRGGDRHDPLVEEEALGPRVQVRQRERVVLHEPLHRSPCRTARGRPKRTRHGPAAAPAAVTPMLATTRR